MTVRDKDELELLFKYFKKEKVIQHGIYPLLVIDSNSKTNITKLWQHCTNPTAYVARTCNLDNGGFIGIVSWDGMNEDDTCPNVELSYSIIGTPEVMYHVDENFYNRLIR